MKPLLIYCLALLTPQNITANTAPVNVAKQPKALVIIADGVRPDALARAATPHIDSLKAHAVYSDKVSMAYPTVSGNGWTSLLTGVTVDKHGVFNNHAKHFEVYTKTDRMLRYPVLPALIEQQDKDLHTASFVMWPKINFFLNRFSVDEYNIGRFGGEIEGKAAHHADTDEKVAQTAVTYLKHSPADFVFFGHGGTDTAGHKYGFRPAVIEYIEAIQRFDKTVGELIKAIKQRPKFEQEDWLIILSTDHGGGAFAKRKHHETPTKDAQANYVNSTTFIYASKPHHSPVEYNNGRQIDVAPTVLSHLGIDIPDYMQGQVLMNIKPVQSD